MSNIDVEIYFSQFKDFFKSNPDELSKIIGKASADDFFKEVYDKVVENHTNGNGIELTRKQIIDIVVKINGISPIDTQKSLVFKNTKFGEICLN
jgi:hypothetical protein